MGRKRAKGKSAAETKVANGDNKQKVDKMNKFKEKKKKQAVAPKEEIKPMEVDEEKPAALKGKNAISAHKKSLESLKDKDPEFYAFLQKEDASLLDFNDSSGEEDDMSEESEGEEHNESEAGDGSEADDDSDDEGEKGRVHKLPVKLEVASDDSNPEDSDEDEDVDESTQKKKKIKEKKETTKGNGILVTPKLINEWSKDLQEHNSIGAMKNAIAAFKAAVQESGGGSEEAAEESKFKVEGSSVFNSVVRLCLTDLLPAFTRFLKLPTQKDPNKPVLPSSTPKWTKIRALTKAYLTDLLQMMAQIGEAAILNVLLKHTHQLSAFFVCFPKLARILLKRSITIWSTGEETSRVLAFLIINRITHYMKERTLEFTLKKMYMAYVKNCKFTSPSTLPMINFMQRSLTEIFALDLNLTYQYAFVYIRQLAIHLRNAITIKKKENSQAVYNWQYIHSLHLWARALSELCPNDTLDPLIYPLTQTIIGTIKLVPTARYYPLRFHCVRSLNLLSASTNTFIPVLPFLTEVFELTDFNKKHKNLSFKPLNFAVVLKLSNAQLNEKSFRDGVIDQMYELLLEQFHVHAHTVSFPELALPAIVQLKQFNKQCKVANYTKQMKQILEKVENTCKTITQRRKTASFNLADAKGVMAWEKRSKDEGTPLSKYYASWRKLRDRELQHEIAGKERISTDKLPEIVRPRGPRKATDEERKEFSELFESDSEDEDDKTRFLPKDERPKKKQKTKRKDEDNDLGDYSEFDSDELEELAGSGDDEDDSEVEEDTEAEEDSENDDEDDDSSDEEEDDDSEDEDQNKEHLKRKTKPKTKGKQTKEVAQDAEEPDDVVEDFELTDDEES